MKTTATMKKLIIMTLAVVISTAFLFAESVETSYAGSEYSSTTEVGQYMLNGINNHSSSISFSYVTTDNDPAALSKDLFEAALSASDMSDYIRYSVYNGYSVSWSYYQDGNGYYHYDFTYNMKYKTTLAQEKAFNKKLNKTVKSLKLSKKSQYNKVKTIYKWITKNVKYDYKSNGYKKYTAYAALNKKKAVCQGYSTLFYRMCKAAGVDTRIITGSSLGQSHAWNIVKLGSKYYNVDSTWDAGTSKYHYFLKSNKNFKSHKRATTFTSYSFNKSYKMAASNY